MKYDFSSIIDRTGMDSIALDIIPFPDVEIEKGFSRLPMWVADMNFATVPTIQEHIIERTKHPLFGYFNPSEEYYNRIINWQASRNQVSGLTKEAIGYENGVLGCVASALQAFTTPGEAILMHAPTYVGFTGTVNANGRKIILSNLVKDEQGIWRMDYEDMDKKIKEHQIHFCIFCSPHNPTGRVWEKEEIESAMEVYLRNQCVVISDEIWSDLILPGYKHIPTQSVSEEAKNATIAIYAPSKTFNLAGLIGSYHIIYNPYLRDKVRKVSSSGHYNSMNVLSMHGLIGAYSEEGAEWTNELCQVLNSNVEYAYDFIQKNFPGVILSRPQGTYMLYLDLSQWCKEHDQAIEDVIRAGIRKGVIWQDGRPFNCPDTIRMNLALPHELVKEAFDRLKKYVFV